jgi:hypothetical protein
MIHAMVDLDDDPECAANSNGRCGELPRVVQFIDSDA